LTASELFLVPAIQVNDLAFSNIKKRFIETGTADGTILSLCNHSVPIIIGYSVSLRVILRFYQQQFYIYFQITDREIEITPDTDYFIKTPLPSVSIPCLF